jgi:taurine dioxygenase
MQIKPVTGTIGAEISGVDLSGEPDPAILDRIYHAVIEHLVVFFRDQDLSPAAQFEFAKTFGTPAQPHPVYPHLPGFDRVVLLENDGDRPPDTDNRSPRSCPYFTRNKFRTPGAIRSGRTCTPRTRPCRPRSRR